MEKTAEVTIVVPHYAVGKVIGRRGTTIDDIRKAHACTVEFLSNDTSDNGDTPLKIASNYGNPMDVKAAAEKVQRIVS